MSTDNPTITPDEINLINIEIAKLRGWKMLEFKKADYVESLKTVITTTYKRWSKNNSKTSTKRVPDYYSSLDACASGFESGANSSYWYHLGKVVGINFGKVIFDIKDQQLIGSATAPQRCEAFLRLHNKWPVKGKV